VKKLFKRSIKNRKVKAALSLQNKNFFWNPHDGIPNIGDYLAFETVNYILNLRDKHCSDIRNGKILSIGSVLHFAKDNDVIWGTGKNGKILESQHTFSNIDVRAVRGPKTRQYLIEKGIDVPEVYGDPGILAPFIYPADKINFGISKRSEFLIVPQLNDDISIYKSHLEKLVTPRQLPASFIFQLVNANKVITSSLHGLILAESFGIPAVYFNSGSGEDIFKYQDYYLGTGRNEFAIGNSIEECMDLTTSQIPDLMERQLRLIEAFPFDRYETLTNAPL